MSPHPCSFLLGWVLLVATAAGEEQYNVRFSHPDKEGDTYVRSVQAQFSVDSTRRVPGYPPHRQQQSFTVELTGTVQVLAVDQTSGEPTKLSCTLSKLLRDGRTVLGEGTVVIAENKDGDTKYTVDDEPVAPPVAQALTEVLPVHRPGAPDNDDTIFGTSEPKKVGDSWPVNRDATARAFSHEGVEVDKDHVAGTVKLTGINESDGRKFLSFVADLNITGLKGVLPDATVITSGTLSTHSDARVPADGEGKQRGERLRWRTNMQVNGLTLADEPLQIDIAMERSAVVTIKEVSK